MVATVTWSWSVSNELEVDFNNSKTSCGFYLLDGGFDIGKIPLGPDELSLTNSS